MKLYKEKIARFLKDNKRLPTYSEMMLLFGFKSKNAVYKIIQKLINDGVLKKDSQDKLVPLKLISTIKVLGTVEAGFPSAAEEELTDTISLDDYLIENKEATFLLKVKGDSMKDAGIIEGDMVLVQRGLEPRVGDIVIAEVDHLWTMKYFKKKDGAIYLDPANSLYKPIFPQEELKIAAVVKAVVRKY